MVGVFAGVRSLIVGRRTTGAGSTALKWSAALAAPAWNVVLALLVVGAAAYPAMTTAPRLAHRFQPLDPTLDGFAHMDADVISDGSEGGSTSTYPPTSNRIAIDWLRRNVEGSLMILEAQLSAYRWGGRISSTIGLRTVLGWTWHEKQQRPGYYQQVAQRAADVATLYGGVGDFASIRLLLDTYHVRLIYFGELERVIYGEASQVRFATAAGPGMLDVLCDANGVTIYAGPPAMD